MVDTFDAAAYHRERVAREQAEKRIAELQEANGRIQRDLGTAQAALCGASKVLSEGGDLLEAHGWLTRQEAYSRAFGWRRSLEARAVQAEKRVEELEAENKRRFAALRYLAVRAKVATGVPADALDAAESWVLRETGYDMPGDGRDVLRCLAETKEALEAARSRAERAERERDEHKANEEFAREMLDRVVIQGGAESWTTREMRDWCCDCKDFKNGYPVSFIRAHADHANCGHRECDGQDEPADRWVHRKIERERDEARAIRREVMLRLQTLIDFCYDKVQWSNGEFIKLLRESGDYLAALSQREEEAVRDGTLKRVRDLLREKRKVSTQDCQRVLGLNYAQVTLAMRKLAEQGLARLGNNGVGGPLRWYWRGRDNA